MGQIRIKDYAEKEVYDLQDIENLRRIANINLDELCKRNDSRLIVFPPKLGSNYDGIENNCVIWLKDLIGKSIIRTEDILGFIGVGDSFLSIGTRFTGQETESIHVVKEDFFLHYLLQKVLKINIFNLPHPHGMDAVLDLLTCMFPGMLSKALRQGLLRRYERRECNDANVRGPININRHIKSNTPFNGKVAYTQRHYSADNTTIQLVRHTIEYIRNSTLREILNVNQEIKDNVATIISATQSYDIRRRRMVIASNKKNNPHPYYTAYQPLITLCIAILEHQKLSFSTERKKVYGILFSGSWLWEEYLYAAIFSKLGFLHPDNRRKTNPLHIFTGSKEVSYNNPGKIERESAPRYPDYVYSDNGSIISSAVENSNIIIIADAKYRHHNFCGDRDNLHQLITYLYITKAKVGALIYPIGTENDDTKVAQLKSESLVYKLISGYGGKYYRIGFEIPKDAEDFTDFTLKMKIEEQRLTELINVILKDNIPPATHKQ